MVDKENLVVLYQNIIHLIDLLPVNYRSKAIEKLLQNMQMTQTEVLQEVLEHIPRDLSQLEDYDKIVEKVIEGESADAMHFMIESLGLRAHLMDENAKGYTVVESVMQHYMKNVCTRTAIGSCVQRKQGRGGQGCEDVHRGGGQDGHHADALHPIVEEAHTEAAERCRYARRCTEERGWNASCADDFRKGPAAGEARQRGGEQRHCLQPQTMSGRSFQEQ